MIRRPPRSPLFPYPPFSRSDLAAHRSEWVEPLRVRYRGLEVCELPPNGQGAAALVALGLLDGLEDAGLPELIEATRAGLADRKSTRLNSSHSQISYAVFCLK